MGTKIGHSTRFLHAQTALRQAEALWCPGAVDGRAPRFSVPLDTGEAVELSWSALHQIEGPAGDAAATAFALTVAHQGMQRHGRGKPLFWIAAPDRLDSGRLYPPALPSGLAGRAVFVDVSRPRDGFWALEEILRSAQAAAVIAELPLPDTTAGRRLQLAAQDGGSLAVLLTPASTAVLGAVPSTPARSRWHVASCPGGTAVRLIRGQGLRPGEWRIDHGAAPVSLHLAASSGDRPVYPQAAA